VSAFRFLNSSQAARRLGVSVKALRLYERRGLVAPARTAAGWRVYSPADLERAARIVALRALGLGLAQVARALQDDGLEPALAAHEAALEGRIGQLAAQMERVRGLRGGLARGRAVRAEEPGRLLQGDAGPRVAFELPWPWGGERFELRDIRPLTYIVGPLGSGKTRLAQRIAGTLPDAGFLGLDRRVDGVAVQGRLDADAALRARVEATLARLIEDGATRSDALTALLAALAAETPAILVVDMIEQGLDQGTQRALIAHLRRRGPAARPLFLLTRSSAILDLSAAGADEAIILCPANHGPPWQVAPHPGAPGYEAVATCLAMPEVRARTAGVIAWQPEVA
jgi:DNA-binding transcriptional MerR regulator